MQELTNAEKLAKAKATIILDHAFFGSLLVPMVLVEKPEISSFSTDGESIFFNPEYLAARSLPEAIFCLAHETLHPALEHNWRMAGMTPNRANQAADYIVNQILIDEKIGQAPKGILHSPALVAQGKTMEGIYRLLPEDAEKNGAGSPGGALDEMKDTGKDEAAKEKQSQENRVKLTNAKNAAKMCGQLSDNMAGILGELLRVKTDWKETLRNFLSAPAKNELSYSRPSRRASSDDFPRPSLIGQQLGDVVIAVDTSGSIFYNLPLLEQFNSEANAIVEDTAPANVRVVYFDSKVLKTENYGRGEAFQLTPIGGGGTRFSPIFAAIEAAGDISPCACVVLTDLECSDFGPAPGYPVLWACTGKAGSPAPWGQVTYL